MADRSRRHPAVSRLPRAAVGVALAGCLLAACSLSDGPAPESASNDASASPAAPPEVAGRPVSPTAHPASGGGRTGLPQTPAAHDATALAGQLDRAAATLRDPNASASAVREAGHFHQLAVHAVATAPTAFRRKVATRLHPQAGVTTRGAVMASRLLRALTAPEPTLPRWRIVAPPPPGQLRRHYRHAQRRTGVPWTYLAAIHLVETRMGRIRGTSTAGARGPMQFLPSTWDLYGAGGDITDPRDAILAAARLLRHHGAPADMAEALWHYNPSGDYVRAVTAHARTMQEDTSAFRGYWHWRVLYRHERGLLLLPEGYPRTGAVLLRPR